MRVFIRDFPIGGPSPADSPKSPSVSGAEGSAHKENDVISPNRYAHNIFSGETPLEPSDSFEWERIIPAMGTELKETLQVAIREVAARSFPAPAGFDFPPTRTVTVKPPEPIAHQGKSDKTIRWSYLDAWEGEGLTREQKDFTENFVKNYLRPFLWEGRLPPANRKPVILHLLPSYKEKFGMPPRGILKSLEKYIFCQYFQSAAERVVEAGGDPDTQIRQMHALVAAAWEIDFAGLVWNKKYLDRSIKDCILEASQEHDFKELVGRLISMNASFFQKIESSEGETQKKIKEEYFHSIAGELNVIELKVFYLLDELYLPSDQWKDLAAAWNVQKEGLERNGIKVTSDEKKAFYKEWLPKIDVQKFNEDNPHELILPGLEDYPRIQRLASALFNHYTPHQRVLLDVSSEGDLQRQIEGALEAVFALDATYRLDPKSASKKV